MYVTFPYAISGTCLSTYIGLGRQMSLVCCSAFDPTLGHNVPRTDEASNELKEAGKRLKPDSAGGVADVESALFKIRSVFTENVPFCPVAVGLRRTCILLINWLQVVPASGERPFTLLVQEVGLLLATHIARIEPKLVAIFVGESLDVVRVLKDLLLVGSAPSQQVEVFPGFVTAARRTLTNNTAPTQDGGGGRGIVLALNGGDSVSQAIETLVETVYAIMDQFNYIFLNNSISVKVGMTLLSLLGAGKVGRSRLLGMAKRIPQHLIDCNVEIWVQVVESFKALDPSLGLDPEDAQWFAECGLIDTEVEVVTDTEMDNVDDETTQNVAVAGSMEPVTPGDVVGEPTMVIPNLRSIFASTGHRSTTAVSGSMSAPELSLNGLSTAGMVTQSVSQVHEQRRPITAESLLAWFTSTDLSRGILALIQTRLMPTHPVGEEVKIRELILYFSLKFKQFNYFSKLISISPFPSVVPAVVARLCQSRDMQGLTVLAARESVATVAELVVSNLHTPLLLQILVGTNQENRPFLTSQIFDDKYTIAQLVEASFSDVIVALLRGVVSLGFEGDVHRYQEGVALVKRIAESMHAPSHGPNQPKRLKTGGTDATHLFAENYLHFIHLIEEVDSGQSGLMLAILMDVVGSRLVGTYSVRTVETIIKLARTASQFSSSRMWTTFSALVASNDKVVLPVLPVLVEGLTAAGRAATASKLIDHSTVPSGLRHILSCTESSDPNEVLLALESELCDSGEKIVSAKTSLLRLFNSWLKSHPAKFTKKSSKLVYAGLDLAKHHLDNVEVVSAVAAFISECGPILLSDADDEVPMEDEAVTAGPDESVSLETGKIRKFASTVITRFLVPNLKSNHHAFAVQEIFTAMGGAQFLNTASLFNKESVLVLTPYLTSSYRASGSGSEDAIDGTQVGSVQQLYAWLSSHVTEPKAKQLLSAMRIVATRDVSLCVWLLPYVVEQVGVEIPETDMLPLVSTMRSAFDRILVSKSGSDISRKIETNGIFQLFDFLRGVLFSKRKIPSKTQRYLSLVLGDTDMARATLVTMVDAAIAVDDYARALQYQEKVIASGGASVPEILKLSEIFTRLDSPTGVIGACSLVDKSVYSKEIEELKMEKLGKFDQLIGLMERDTSVAPVKRLQLLVDSGHYTAAADAGVGSGGVSDKMYEACWKLGDWSRLDSVGTGGQMPVSVSYDAVVSDALRTGKCNHARIGELRIGFLKKISINLNFSEMAQMFVLNRLGRPGGEVSAEGVHVNCRGLVLEALHGMRRDEHVLIELLKHYRKTGDGSKIRQLIYTARPALSAAMNEVTWNRHCEWAKCCWFAGERDVAREGLLQAMAVDTGTGATWRAELLVLKWSAEMELLIPKIVIGNYRELTRRALTRDVKDRESVAFGFGAYLDRVGLVSLLGSAPSTGASDVWNKHVLVREVAVAYFDSIKFDHSGKRILFTLNRLFQLHWELSHSGDANLLKYAGEIVSVIQAGWRQIPAWVWFVALPQLLSRVVGSTDFSPVVEEIIVAVFAEYPRQSSWLVIPQLLTSRAADRKEAGSRIVAKVVEKSNYPNIQNLVAAMRIVGESLVGVARYEGSGGSLMKSLSESRDGARLLRDTGGLLVMPIKAQISSSCVLSGSPPFSNEVRIAKFQDPVHVYNTKAKPKRISVVDTGGRIFHFILKLEKKTDLRKDSRMMDFVNVVNKEIGKKGGTLLAPLRTYSVLTLAEDSALIEFVPNLVTVRKIIDESLGRQGKSVSLYLNKEVMGKLANKAEGFAYFQSIVDTIPPMIAEWLAREFVDPQRWLRARNTFTKSQAMWSIVGHVVGLGDRHPDNILIDTRTGEVVHVDFDCIFSRGMILTIPELVPFRLTRICVSAMGVTGVEGTFRVSCEQIMALVRDKKQMLLSVLHAFIADPLIDWQGGGTSYRKAKDVIGAIEKKLNGYVDVGELRAPSSVAHEEKLIVYSDTGDKNSGLGKDKGAALSVAGQVDELIRAAVCQRNLARMYLGWMPLF